MGRITTVAEDIETHQVDIEMLMSMEMVGENWEQSESTEMEMYLIGNTMYMKTNEPGIPEQWIEQTTPDLWDQQNQVEKQLELLETSDIENLGRESVDGVNCYKVKLISNLEKLF